MEWKKRKAEDEKDRDGDDEDDEGQYAHLQISRYSDIDVARRRIMNKFSITWLLIQFAITINTTQYYTFAILLLIDTFKCLNR